MIVNDLHWLAGLLEGEGSFLMTSRGDGYNYGRIQVQMCDRDVIERVAGLFETSVYEPKNYGNQVKPVFKAVLTGKRAVALMKELLPLMGERRSAKIEEVLSQC